MDGDHNHCASVLARQPVCGDAVVVRSERSAHLVNLLRPELLQVNLID